MKSFISTIFLSLNLLTFGLIMNSCKIKSNNRISIKSDGNTVDSKSAIEIAKESWKNKFGYEIIEGLVITANLENDSIWVVNGINTKYVLGGDVFAKIRKYDGVVMKIWYSK